MKRSFIVFFMALVVILTGCANKPGIPLISFESPEINIGNIKAGSSPITVNFNFKNTGEQPLRILNVAADCTCTVPSYTKQSVKRDSMGTIKIEFNPKAVTSTGVVERKVVVYSNTQPKLHTLKIKMFINK